MKNKLKKKHIVIAVALLLIIATSGYLIYSSFKKSNQKDTPRAVYEQVSEVVKNKGFSAGQSVLDEKIKDAKTAKEQAELYIKKAALSDQETDKDKTKALEYANKAEELNPTEVTVLQIASLEERQGNTDNAIKYYKIYLERMSKKLKPESSSDDGLSPEQADYNYYKKRLASLEESKK